MENIIHLSLIKKIEFQIDENNVLMSLYEEKNNETNLNVFVISQTDINKILGLIQQKNEHIDIYKSLEIKQLQNKITLCTLNLSQITVYSNSILESYSNIFLKKIRA